VALGYDGTADTIASGRDLTLPAVAGAAERKHGRSPAQIAFERLRGDKVAVVCFAIVVFFVLIAIFAPVLARLEGQTPDTLNQNLIGEDTLPTIGPTAAHWFGIEPRLGRDLFARWVYGARPSLVIGVLAATLSTAVGVVMGLLAGYLGGAVDKVITWLIDFLLSLPFLLFVIALVPITEQRFAPLGGLTAEQTSTIRFWVLITVLVLFGWSGLARLIRGEVVSLREREFISAAKVLGVPTRQILFKELLPNLVGPIIVSVSIAVPAYITLEATLSYLGAGLVEPTASWGRTIDNAQNSYDVYPLYLWPPVIGVVVLVLALSLLGDAIRDAFDPNTRR
jgi:ABC-type dipeptide/oligopeptide/nickel transport system permease subunit